MSQSNRSAAYWQQRRLQDKMISQFFIEDEVAKADALYRRQITSIRKQVDSWYQTYGIDGQLPLSLTTDQLSRAENRKTIANAVLNDPYVRQMLEETSVYKLTRLQSMELELQKELYTFYRADEVLMAESLQRGAIDGFTHTERLLTEMSGGSFDRPNTQAIRQLLRTSSESWVGNRNWSQRLWGSRTEFGQKLHQVLEEGVAQGYSQDRMIRQFQAELGGARSDVARLIRTETAHIYEQGTYAAYEEAEVLTYRFMATLDVRTSAICASLDGKVFPLNEAQPGTNYPPMHPNCRSTTIPGRVEPRSRVARDAEGDNVIVPGSQNYEEWLRNDPRLAQERKAWANRSQDMQQMQEYRRLLGREAPRSLSAFQQMKYGDPDAWATLKSEASKARRAK